MERSDVHTAEAVNEAKRAQPMRLTVVHHVHGLLVGVVIGELRVQASHL